MSIDAKLQESVEAKVPVIKVTEDSRKYSKYIDGREPLYKTKEYEAYREKVISTPMP